MANDDSVANYTRNAPFVQPGEHVYNTPLKPAVERQFRGWLKKNSVPFDPSAAVSDYDMRGFYKALMSGDPAARSAVDPNDQRLHYPDYWKTPYHQTFSNESQWAKPDAPAWTGDDKLALPDGTVVYDDRAQHARGGSVRGYAAGGAPADEADDWITPPAQPVDDWIAPPKAGPPTASPGLAEFGRNLAGAGASEEEGSALRRVGSAAATAAEPAASAPLMSESLQGPLGTLVKSAEAWGVKVPSTIYAGAVGGIVQALKEAGMPADQADRLERDLQGMPEAFLGAPGTLHVPHPKEGARAPGAAAEGQVPGAPKAPSQEALDAIAGGHGGGAGGPKDTLDSIATTGKPPAPAAPQAGPAPGEATPGFWAPPDKVSHTTPERPEDLRAQIDAMLDPENPKDSVFVPAASRAQVPDDLPGVERVEHPEGVLLTRNPDKANAFRQNPSDDTLAAVLGYPETKREALNSPNPVVVQGVDSAGNVRGEAAAGNRVDETREALQAQAGPNGTTRTLSPEEAQQRRAQPEPFVNIKREIGGEPVTFPDKNHADLYDLGMAIRRGSPQVEGEITRLLQELGGFVEDTRTGRMVSSPAQLRKLATDYSQEINESGNRDPRFNSVIDPDQFVDYTQQRIYPRIASNIAGNVAPMEQVAAAAPKPTTFLDIPQTGGGAGFVPVKSGEAVTSTGARIPVQYSIADVRDLTASHTLDLRPNPSYPPGLQPRDRTRAATETQITAMLNPDRFSPELLGESPDAANGAPIVGADGLVESGNARTIALGRAYDQDMPAARAYRAWLERQGYPVDGVERPVLVRVNQAPMSGPEREAFARAANKPAVLQMSAPERAVADARTLPGSALELAREGDLLSAGNRPFINAILKHIATPEEMGAIVDSEGRISAEGLRRVQGVILAKAYGDPRILQTLLEATDTNIKAIGSALLDAAPRWAKMIEEAKAGTIEPTMDITPDLMAAVKLVDVAREKGMGVGELVRGKEAQSDIFSGKAEEIPPRVKSILSLMMSGEDFDKRVGQAKIATALRFYTEEALKSQPGEGLFGSKAEPEPIIKAARERAQGTSEEQPDLLQRQAVGSTEGAGSVRPGPGARGDEAPGQEAAAPGVGRDQGEPRAEISPGGRDNILVTAKALGIKDLTENEIAAIQDRAANGLPIVKAVRAVAGSREAEPYRPGVIRRDNAGRPIERQPITPGGTDRLEDAITERSRGLREEPDPFDDGRREPQLSLPAGAARRTPSASPQTQRNAATAAAAPGNAPGTGGPLGTRPPGAPGGGGNPPPPGGTGRVGGGGGGNRPPGGRQGQMPLPGGSTQARQNGVIARSFLGKIFSPATVSPAAEDQAALARREYGQAKRITQQARDGLEKFREDSPNLRTPEGDNLMSYIEGRSAGATLGDPRYQPLADYIRALNKDRQRQIAALPNQLQRTFIEDYYSHMWKDPKAAQTAVNTSGTGGWQGSGRNLKGRSIPTYADGIAMGLDPKHPNIVDGEMDYIANMDRFLATNRILNRMQANGAAQFFIPGRAPDGWTELKGILAERSVPTTNASGAPGAIPQKLYAPEDVARVYNNMISRGIYGTDAAPVYDKLLRFKNAQTFLELSLSAFHATTMATEATISEFGRGVGLAVAGKPLSAAATAGKALVPGLPAVKSYMLGRKVAAEYLEPGSQGAEIGRVTNLIAAANASPLGRGEAQYFAGTRGAFGKGAQSVRQVPAAVARDMRSAWKEAVADIGSRQGVGSKALGVAQYGGQNFARALDTISAPLFDHLIPRLKAGSAAQRISDWIGQHPSATFDEQLGFARDVVDSMDNRFGELVYDNLTWNQAIKQPLFLSLRAMGWDIGTHREIEGGILDAMRGRFTPRTEYVVGLLATYPVMNAALSYLHTGQMPSGMDFVAYNTGEKDERGQPIRALVPGYGREFATLFGNMYAKGIGNAALDYAGGKVASTWTTLTDLVENRDYRGDPIGPPGAGVMTAKDRAKVPEFVKRYLDYIWEEAKPITFRDPGRQYQGVSNAERLFAVRKAPLALNSPEGAKRFYGNQEEKPKGPDERWKLKLRREAQQRQREKSTP